MNKTIKFQHVFREANFLANTIAAIGHAGGAQIWEHSLHRNEEGIENEGNTWKVEKFVEDLKKKKTEQTRMMNEVIVEEK